MPGRTKVSVSLPTELVTLVDRGVRARRFLSRSAAIEEALRALERAQRDREIEAYYAGRSEADREDERAWGELGAEALATSSRAADARAPYGVRRGGPRRGGPAKKR